MYENLLFVILGLLALFGVYRFLEAIVSCLVYNSKPLTNTEKNYIIKQIKR